MNINFVQNINLTKKGEFMDKKFTTDKEEKFKELIINYLLKKIKKKQS